MFYVLSFIFGASIGSFVQVLATRLHVAPSLYGRSKCLSCGETLRASDLIPVVSYLMLAGKCRHCKTRYGIEALLVEVFYGSIFVLLYHFILKGQVTFFISSLWLIYYTALFISFGVISLYDRAHTYIPMMYLILYCVLTLIMLGMRYIDDSTSSVLLAPIAVSLPFIIMWMVTKGKGLGFGDVVLFLGVGAFFGIEQGFAVLLLSVWMGALVGIYMYLVARKKNTIGKTALPFVPFILLAFLLVLFTDINIFSIANLFA